MYRPTYIEVDGNILENNIKNIKTTYNNYTYYFGVVKNNSYHHGIYAIKYMIKAGINYLAVSSLEEAITARSYDRKIPILCLEPIDVSYVYDAINNNVTLTIGSIEEAEEIAKCKFSDTLKIHLKIDSGMSRLGFRNSKDFNKAYKILTETKNVEIEGVYTHLATSGVIDKYYNEQVENFLSITKGIDLKKIPIVHVDRSLTLVVHDKLDFVNGVRLGICMYGFSQNIPEGGFLRKLKRKHLQKKLGISNVHLTNNLNLNYVMSMYSKVIEVRKIKAGDFVGYAALYVAKEDEIIATIPVGYADGVKKEFEYVYINNEKCEIVAECMDMIMVKVNNNVKTGDIVEVFGKNQTIKDLADRLGIVGHKALSLFSTRVPIVYKYNGETREIKY